MEPEGRIFVDRSERGKLRLTGEQRAWFLHQILTQAVEDIAPGEAREAAMLTVHGRMVGHMEVLATEDSLLIHFEPELRQTLPDAIARYVLATRVEIEDVTDEMGLVLVAGEDWNGIARAIAPDAFLNPTKSLGSDAGYVWVERAELGTLLNALAQRGFAPALENDFEAIRIANGIARWGRDMNEKTLPQEARIEERAIDFEKGCYVGQEAVAKIHFRGKVNRLLRRLAVADAVAPGTDITADGEKIGMVTSAADGKALAMLRHTIEVGAVVSIGDVPATVEA